MAVLQQRALITAEELFDSADDGYRCELVRGELVRMNPTGGRHAAVAVRIARLLDEHVEAHDLGVCGTAEPGFILQRTPDVVRAPDVSFVARSRIPAGHPRRVLAMRAGPRRGGRFSSRSPRRRAWQDRRAHFAAGTRLVWLVEPAARVVYVYRSQHDVQVLGDDGELIGEDVLPGFRCAVRRLFP